MAGNTETRKGSKTNKSKSSPPKTNEPEIESSIADDAKPTAESNSESSKKHQIPIQNSRPSKRGKAVIDYSAVLSKEDLETIDPEALRKGDDGSSILRWTKAEDMLLRKAVNIIGPRNWRRIATDYLQNTRTDVQCLHRWQKVLKPGLVKGPWTPEEDKIIMQCRKRGIKKWSEIAAHVKGRIGKQCRERWFNHLDPDIKHGEWTEEEDRKLFQGQALLGNKWSKIAKLYLPGRPENAVKNRWNAATRRRRTTNKRNKEDGTVIKRVPRQNGNRTKRQQSLTTVQARFRALRPDTDVRAVSEAMEGMVSLAMLSGQNPDNLKMEILRGAAQHQLAPKQRRPSSINTTVPLEFTNDLTSKQTTTTRPSIEQLQTPTNFSQTPSANTTQFLSPTASSNKKLSVGQTTTGRAMEFATNPKDMQDTLAALQSLAAGKNREISA